MFFGDADSFNLSFSQERKKHQSTHQVDVVEDESGFVHLAQDQKHFIVDELFVLFQVAVHVLFQLRADLLTKFNMYVGFGL